MVLSAMKENKPDVGTKSDVLGGLFCIQRSRKSSPVRLILSRDINKVREQN